MWFMNIFGKKILTSIVSQKVIKILKDNILIVILSLICLIGGGYVWYKYNSLSNQVKESTAKLENLRVEYNRILLEKKQFEDSLDRQNANIKVLEEKRDLLDKAMREQNAYIEQLRQRNNKRYQEINNEKVVETCDGVISWMIDKAQERNK